MWVSWGEKGGTFREGFVPFRNQKAPRPKNRERTPNSEASELILQGLGVVHQVLCVQWAHEGRRGLKIHLQSFRGKIKDLHHFCPHSLGENSVT